MPGARVLIGDDDAAIVALVTAVLEDEGYTVASAVDGAALQVAQERPPAVILLDLMMPQMDGAELSRRLRADGRTAAIPLILLSAQASAATAALPVDDWLAKPFELEELVACVGRWAALWTDGRLRWCRRGAASYAFDRARKRVVAWYLPQAGGWRVYVRDASTSYGPFATALAAQREAEKRVLA